MWEVKVHVFFKRVGVLQLVPGLLKQGKMLDPLHAVIPVVKPAQTHFNVGKNVTLCQIRCRKKLVFTKVSQHMNHIGLRPIKIIT